MRQSLVGLTAFFMLVSAAVAKKPAGQQNPTPAPPKAQRVAYAWQSSQGTPMPPPPMKDQQSSQYTPPAQEQSAPNAGSKTVPDDQQQQPSPSPTMPPPGTPPPSTQNQQAWPRPNVGVETPPDDRRPSTDGSQPAPPASRQVTLPAGTRVLLQLQSPIYTKTARVGDGVYCESTFPVTQENHMAIPAAT